MWSAIIESYILIFCTCHDSTYVSFLFQFFDLYGNQDDICGSFPDFKDWLTTSLLFAVLYDLSSCDGPCRM